jgi:uncharacterized protein (TIGR03435 family)
MIPANLSPVANHLWQSTLFAAAAWLLTLALRKNHAGVRYKVWLAASIKFLIPFSLLVAAGSQFAWRTSPAMEPSPVFHAMDQISQPFALPADRVQPVAAAPSSNLLPAVLLVVWFVGFTISAVAWYRWWQRFRAAIRIATPLPLDLPVPVMTSPERLEPGVFGIRNPVLLLPEGIGDRLEPEQLRSILAHELCHVRRRDNLTAAMHMVVESVFWFYPLVWWIRVRLLEERENACDEEVLSLATDPEAYAEGILNVCKFYLQVPPCVAGAAGANLRKRLERVLSRRLAVSLSLPKRLMLLGAGLCTIAGPIAIGLLNAPMGSAQAQPGGRLTFEVASVKLSPPDAAGRSVSHSAGARLVTSNATVKQLVYLAYQVMPFQVSGGPGWVESDGFDIEAKAANPKASQEQFRQMVQTLLTDRFQLKFHFATKEMPVYALRIAKNGSKLVEAKDDTPEASMRNGRGEMTGEKANMAMFASALSRPLQRKVVDETGLSGAYNFKLKFVPDENPLRPTEDGAAPSIDGSSIFTALREQLGLTLKPAKGPVEVLVIDHAEKPAPN